MHVHGKLYGSSTHVQCTIRLVLVCSSVRLSKYDGKLVCHTVLKSSLSPSNGIARPASTGLGAI